MKYVEHVIKTNKTNMLFLKVCVNDDGLYNTAESDVENIFNIFNNYNNNFKFTMEKDKNNFLGSTLVKVWSQINTK